MGTRADFYIGRGLEAEWLGSIAWDGYPDGITLTQAERDRIAPGWPDGGHLFDATTDKEFRERLAAFFLNRDDVTLPTMGWPWPWEDSRTTDYAYAFHEGRVFASRFGRSWIDPRQPEPEEELPKDVVFPDMTDRKKVTLGKRSGVIVLGG
jgi:hypothetical protein